MKKTILHLKAAACICFSRYMFDLTNSSYYFFPSPEKYTLKYMTDTIKHIGQQTSWTLCSDSVLVSSLTKKSSYIFHAGQKLWLTQTWHFCWRLKNKTKQNKNKNKKKQKNKKKTKKKKEKTTCCIDFPICYKFWDIYFFNLKCNFPVLLNT